MGKFQTVAIIIARSVHSCAHSSQRANHRPLVAIMGAAAVRSAPRRQAVSPTPLHSPGSCCAAAARFARRFASCRQRTNATHRGQRRHHNRSQHCSGRQAAAQQTGLTGTDRTGQGRQRTLDALLWSIDACSHSSQRANHRPIESIMGAAAVRSAPRRQARRPTPLHSHDALGGIAAPAAPAARTARSSPSHSAVAYSCLRLARAPMY